MDFLIPGAVPQADFLRPDWGETQSSLPLFSLPERTERFDVHSISDHRNFSCALYLSMNQKMPNGTRFDRNLH